jgi:branched-chain amino acid transport system permease protein
VIGGIVALLLCLVGMVEEFNERDIIAGVISMGQTVVLMVFLAIGYLTAGRLAARSWQPFLAAAAAGLIISAMLAGLVLLINRVPDVRRVLVFASPGLVEILTFGQEEVGPGLIILLAAGAVAALAGAGLHALPGLWRRPVLLGLLWVSLIGLLQELIQVSLSRSEVVSDATAWMFGRGIEKGLTGIGAVVVFVIVAGASILWSRWAPTLRSRYQALTPGAQRSSRAGGLALLVFVLIFLPAVVGLYLSEVLNQVGLFILMGLGLNIVVGFAGLLDLGYVAFFALGAYSVGVLTSLSGELVFAAEWGFWFALPAAILVALAAGVILGVPVLNMRGDYLAIVTLGFGEIIRILALSDWLKPFIGGSQGIVQIPPIAIGPVTFNNSQTLYYIILGGALLALFVARRLRDSRLGRSWKALREDEDVAQAMGINLVMTKLLAFATGAAFSGLSGAILATKLGTIYPHSFALLISIYVLAVIIVGGIGSIPGVIVGAFLLIGLPELLREFAEYRLWIYGALLVLMMVARPEGFLPEATHRRELHEAPAMPAEVAGE